MDALSDVTIQSMLLISRAVRKTEYQGNGMFTRAQAGVVSLAFDPLLVTVHPKGCSFTYHARYLTPRAFFRARRRHFQLW